MELVVIDPLTEDDLTEIEIRSDRMNKGEIISKLRDEGLLDEDTEATVEIDDETGTAEVVADGETVFIL